MTGSFAGNGGDSSVVAGKLAAGVTISDSIGGAFLLIQEGG